MKKLFLTLVRKILKIMRLVPQIIGTLGLVFFGYLTLSSMRMHDPWFATFYPLFAFISVKLLVYASWNRLDSSAIRKVFFSLLNFIWLSLWLMVYLARFAGLQRGAL
jgi:hypothetical protein